MFRFLQTVFWVIFCCFFSFMFCSLVFWNIQGSLTQFEWFVIFDKKLIIEHIGFRDCTKVDTFYHQHFTFNATTLKSATSQQNWHLANGKDKRPIDRREFRFLRSTSYKNEKKEFVLRFVCINVLSIIICSSQKTRIINNGTNNKLQ